MKVRIGFGASLAGLGGEELASLGAGVAGVGLDSLWLPEVLSAPGPDPLVALSWVAAANPRLKIGTTMLLPGRNLARLAKQVATLDALSGGRFLVTFVPGLPRGPERSAVGVEPALRGQAMEEALPVLRRLWAGERVTYRGACGVLEDVAVSPVPVQDPFDVWFGGNSAGALDRCGRLADGWLPAMCTPEEAAAGRATIEAVADAAGRTISPEHFGVSLGYAREPLEEAQVAALRARSRGHRLEDLVPVGLPALRRRIEQFVDVGFSKFVVRPLVAPARWREELERLAGAVGDLQT
ncbi:MAG TPA: LLM class flavin-dependent oxidoreductase [Acidimicrobiales bacterium]|nr:LLM class flavin-dependent oxidoreductase [Acidimicrobiales bacterium]